MHLSLYLFIAGRAPSQTSAGRWPVCSQRGNGGDSSGTLGLSKKEKWTRACCHLLAVVEELPPIKVALLEYSLENLDESLREANG